jgi:hypothetical protein
LSTYEKEEEIQRLQERVMKRDEQLEQAKEALQESEDNQAEVIRVTTENLPQQSPGPNIFKPRTPRPQDVTYQAIVESTKVIKKNDNEITNETAVIHMFSSLIKALKDTAKRDVPYPKPKFNGNDSMWGKWLKQ